MASSFKYGIPVEEKRTVPEVFPAGVDLQSITDHYKRKACVSENGGFIRVGDSNALRVRTGFTLFPLGLKSTWQMSSRSLPADHNRVGVDTRWTTETRGASDDQRDQIIAELAGREARRLYNPDEPSFLIPPTR